MLALLNGCGTDTPPDPAPRQAAPTGQSGFTDDFLMGKAFDTAVSVPQDFYEDPSRGLSVSFSLAHLRADDIGTTGVHDLCSDDMSTAAAWSDAVSPDWPVVTLLETDTYVEITRQRSDLPDWWALHRVYRCTYLERTDADPSANTGFAGRLGPERRSAGTLKFIAEYLWQFSEFSNPGSAVLSSAPSTRTDGWRHTLSLVHRVPDAGTVDGCDRIEQLDWHYDLAADGTLSRTLQTVRSFDARAVGGLVERCDAT
ncbi:MAG: hypothetical protein AAFU65_10630 [Pseudomonadota bacterium]